LVEEDYNIVKKIKEKILPHNAKYRNWYEI
jgi:hypothetical protein